MRYCVPVNAAAIEELDWLAPLRPDERERAARFFHTRSLAAGAALDLDAAQLGVVVSGETLLERAELAGLPPVKVPLVTGDRWGELALFAGASVPVRLQATSDSELALLDAAGFRDLTREFPVVWNEVAQRLARELKWKNDLLREIQELDQAQADAATLELFLESKRRHLSRRRAGIARRAGRIAWRAAVAEPSREPAFWILTGFVLAIVLSRVVVGSILRFHLEHELFNLHANAAGNPLHTHHFNYGFALIVTTGLLAFWPRMRPWIRVIAFAFGFGTGLVFDEFALLWNLNPDYYQTLSYEAQAVLVALLAQVIWLRRVYVDLGERALRWMRRRG